MARKARKAKTAKKTKKSKKKAKARKVIKRRQERKLEEGLEETFPASDPLAITDPVRSERHNGG